MYAQLYAPTLLRIHADPALSIRKIVAYLLAPHQARSNPIPLFRQSLPYSLILYRLPRVLCSLPPSLSFTLLLIDTIAVRSTVIRFRWFLAVTLTSVGGVFRESRGREERVLMYYCLPSFNKPELAYSSWERIKTPLHLPSFKIFLQVKKPSQNTFSVLTF